MKQYSKYLRIIALVSGVALGAFVATTSDVEAYGPIYTDSVARFDSAFVQE